MISCVVMAYNEIESIAATVNEIIASLKRTGADFEVIIIDDGSDDGTGATADMLGKDLGCVRVVHHNVNMGLGGVYRTGFSSAKGEAVTFFPADGQFPALIIEQFYPLLSDADMVLGYIPNRHDSSLGKVLSWAERMIFNILFGDFPKFQGILMFKREILANVTLNSSGRGWTILMELILKTSRKGYKIVNAPIDFRKRLYGRSKVNNFRTAWANLKQAFVLRTYL